MHELAVTQSVLELGLSYAPPGAQISDLYLVIGELSSFVDDSVQFYWDLISAGTAAAGAQLHFRRIPAQMTCRACGCTYSPRDALACPDCDSLQVTVTAGEEFYLESIEVNFDTEAITAKDAEDADESTG